MTSNNSVAEGHYTVGADGVVTVSNIVLHLNFISGPRKDKCMQDDSGNRLLDQNGNPAPLRKSRCTVSGDSNTNSSFTLTFQSLPGHGVLRSAAAHLWGGGSAWSAVSMNVAQAASGERSHPEDSERKGDAGECCNEHRERTPVATRPPGDQRGAGES